jgi:beta-glucosidase
MWILLLSILLPICLSHDDKDVTVAQRVKKLLDSMSLDEKIAQTFAGHGPRDRILPTVQSVGIGAAKLSPILGWGSHTPVEMIRARNEIQKQALNSSGIPISFFDEGDHGAVAGGTIFPMPVGQGSSWNVSLVKSIASAIAAEASAVGIDTLFAPVINMVVDPRFGRLQENFSENPILTKKLAVASVLGLQNSSDSSRIVAAVGKHFAAYGDASGGLNGGASTASERLLYDIYLRPWKAMARAGLKGLMPAHNTILHVPCHANVWLLNTTMRNAFQFEGVMVSDCNDVAVLQDFRMASNISHAAAMALRAGVDWDLQCEQDPDKWAYNHLKEALQHGLITEHDINRAVTRVLTHKMELGLFDNRAFADETTADKVLDNAEHRKLALEAAEQSMVLLINRNETLPIDFSSVNSIALLGPTASRAGCNCSEAVSSLMGDYSFGGAHVVTLDEALQASFPSVRVNWARGGSASGPSTRTGVNQTEIDEAVALAQLADVTILVLGDVQGGCGEWGDRDSLDLQGSQLALLEAVAPVAKKTVVILVHGRPQTFGENNRVLSQVDAMFAAWRPGEEFGTAMVRLLNGQVSPSAKLSQSWPRAVGHVGSGSVPWLQEVKGKWISNKRGSMDEDGRRYNNYVSSSSPDPTPLFYFGYGLSYTTFQYESMEVQTPRDTENEDIIWEVKVTLSNMSNRDGVEIVQVYVKDPILPYVPFWKRLVGFTRCFVAARTTKSCIVVVTKEDLACYDPMAKDKMRVYGGTYQVRVGGSSNSDSMVKEIAVEADNEYSFKQRGEEISLSSYY